MKKLKTNFHIEENLALVDEALMVVEPWIVEILTYCSKEGITPKDLITLHKSQYKPNLGRLGTKEVKIQDLTKDMTKKNITKIIKNQF